MNEGCWLWWVVLWRAVGGAKQFMWLCPRWVRKREIKNCLFWHIYKEGKIFWNHGIMYKWCFCVIFAVVLGCYTQFVWWSIIELRIILVGTASALVYISSHRKVHLGSLYRWLCTLHREEQAPPLPARCAVSAIGGISSRQRLVYHRTSVWISSHRKVPCASLVVDVSNFVRVAGKNLCAKSIKICEVFFFFFGAVYKNR